MPLDAVRVALRQAMAEERCTGERYSCKADVNACRNDQRSRVSGHGKWDCAWKFGHGAAGKLFELVRGREVVQPLRRRSDYMSM